MISTLVRGAMLPQTNVSEPNHKDGIFIFFPECEVEITKLEKALLSQFDQNELLLRMLTGRLDSLNKIDQNTQTSIAENHENSNNLMGPPRCPKRFKHCENQTDFHESY